MNGQTHLEHGSSFDGGDPRCRFMLTREWDHEKPTVLWIGLNPSTADADKLDPTLRRVLGFAQRDGFGRLLVGNVTPYRSTDPNKHPPTEVETMQVNDEYLLAAAQEADKIVAGWGVHAAPYGWDLHVEGLLREYDLYTWGTTQGGQPRHPLYPPTCGATPLKLWRAGQKRAAQSIVSGKDVHIYVCKDRIKRGEPAVTVAEKDTGKVVARGSDLCLNGEWHLRQYDDPKPCGSTVVLETIEGTWEIA